MGAIQLLMEKLGYVSLKRYGLELTAGGRIVSHRTAVVDTDLIVGWDNNDSGAMELPRWFVEMSERSEQRALVDKPPGESADDDREKAATRGNDVVAEDLTDELEPEPDEDDWRRALSAARGDELGPVRVLRRAEIDDVVAAASPHDDLLEHVEAVDSGAIVATLVEPGDPDVTPVVDNPLVDEWYSAFDDRPRADIPVVISLRELPNDETAYEALVVGVRPLRVVIPKADAAARPPTIIPVPPLPSVGTVTPPVIPVPELPTVDEAMAANPREIRKRPTMPTIPPLPPPARPLRARFAKGTESDELVNVPPPKLVVVPPLPRIVKPDDARR